MKQQEHEEHEEEQEQEDDNRKHCQHHTSCYAHTLTAAEEAAGARGFDARVEAEVMMGTTTTTTTTTTTPATIAMVVDIIVDLRRSRDGLVETPQQLKFILDVVAFSSFSDDGNI